MINLLKSRQAANGATAEFHRVERIEFSKAGDALLVYGRSWATRLAADDDAAGVENWSLRVPVEALPSGAALLSNVATAIISSDYFSGAVHDTTDGAASDLANAKVRKRNELTAAWSAELAAGVTVGSKVAPSDAAAWTRYLALKAMAEDADWVDIPIPLLDGTFELMTKAKAGALWAALKTLERTLLDKLKTKVEAVQAAATVEEVEAITWPTP